MDKKIQKLLNFMESENVEIASDKASKFGGRDEARLIFSELMPERVCSYDTEIIDDVDGYHSVIQSHMQATLGEWAAKDIVVSGTANSEVTIEFLHDGKKVKWKFEQNGTDYVSDDFYKKLNSWVSRNLEGKFSSLPTYGQDVAFVYLPKKSAAKVDAFTGSTITANKFVDHFRGDDDLPSSFWDLRFDKRFDINCRDDSGETALTAAIKAGKPKKALEALDEVIEVDPLVKNKSGMSPLQLSRQMELQEVTEYLEGFLTTKSQNWSGIEKQIYSEPMIELINALKKSQNADTMFANNRFGNWIEFGRTETFELGHDTLTVKPYRKPGIYEDHGTYNLEYFPETVGGYSKENVGLEDTLELIDQFYK